MNPENGKSSEFEILYSEYLKASDRIEAYQASHLKFYQGSGVFLVVVIAAASQLFFHCLG